MAKWNRSKHGQGPNGGPPASDVNSIPVKGRNFPDSGTNEHEQHRGKKRRRGSRNGGDHLVKDGSSEKPLPRAPKPPNGPKAFREGDARQGSGLPQFEAKKQNNGHDGPRNPGQSRKQRRKGHQQRKQPQEGSHSLADRIDQNKPVDQRDKTASPASAPAPPPPPPPVPEPKPVLTYREGSIYERVLQVGEGTYGKVFKARNVDTGRMAALKRLRMESEKDGMPITAVREIKLLQSLRHSSIVALREIMIESGSIYMAFEYLDHDLAGLLANPELQLNQANVKFLFRQMVDGLAYLHHKGILHRDIKGSNILVDNQGHIKLADFGLARTIDKSNPNAHYTNRVITLWYKPPELLLGATVYSGEIDVWGMGCLLVELFNRKAIFRAQDEIGQLTTIFDVMGTPDKATWPNINELPWSCMLLPNEPKPSRFDEVYGSLLKTNACIDLAKKLLALNPVERISAEKALQHEYFSEEPAPAPLDLTNIGEWHDFEAKRRRRRKDREERADSRGKTSAPSEPSEPRPPIPPAPVAPPN